MSAVKAEHVKKGIAAIWENLQCPICLDLMSEPVSTRCDHQFCKFCINKVLERTKRKETSCPVCKTKVTKRSLQESPGFQKLVEGLQNLVRSYEIDTHTNFLGFTGFPQKSQGASVETESGDQQGSGENGTSAGDVTEKEVALSSSTADCLESSHNEIKPADPEDVPQRTEASDSQMSQDIAPLDDGKTSRRRSKRLCSKPDRITDKRQKRSVKKVSEWLLKISPTSDERAEGNTEGVLPACTDSNAEKERPASDASTEIHSSAHDKAGTSPERGAPCRGLEEQVFGAVYKRERKSATVTKSFSPKREIVPVASSGIVSEKDEEIKMPKRRSSHKLTPADFIKKTLNEDGVNQDQAEKTNEQENPSKALRSSGEQEKVVQSGPGVNMENTGESPTFEIPLKKARRKSTIQEVWQDGRNLLEKENNKDNKKDRKRRITRSSCDPVKGDDLETGKNTKYTKSLSLVTAGAQVVDFREKVPSRPKLIETEVNIESFPSSPELKSPDARKTRRSLRLQEFTEEVQGLSRKRRSKRALPKPENNPSTNLDEPGVKPDRTSLINASQSENVRNCCVYNDELERIETMQSSEDAAAPKCVSEGTVAEELSLVSVVPDTVDHDEHITSHPNRVANSTSPLAALVPESLAQKRQESPPTMMPAVQHRDADLEEDTNDSELDTEQLMKTFKATKRRSFYLGSPRTSQSRTQEKLLYPILEKDKQEPSGQAEIPGVSPDDDLNPCELAPHEVKSQTFRVSIADVACVSLLQVKSPAPPSLPKDTQKDRFIKTSGAIQVLEKVAVSQELSKSQDSTHGEKVEIANSIQLFSTSVTQEEPRISCSKDLTRSLKSSIVQGKPFKADIDKGLNKTSSIQQGNMTNSETLCNNFESSVTPDGLVPSGPEPPTTTNEPKMDEGEILSQPCSRRKRKAQRLESSDSESSDENDYLPPLMQIFDPCHMFSDPEKNSLNQEGAQAKERSLRPRLDPLSQKSRSLSEAEAQSSPASQTVASYQTRKSLRDVSSNHSQDGDVPEPSCRDEWLTSSQGSVDLFGTPRECKEVVDVVCGNSELSIESTQYSSEIVTTQQRQEMQQELHRLERMMAVVSEALQKKDGELDNENKMEDQHAGQRGRLRSQRSCNSRRPTSQRSEVNSQRAVPGDSSVEVKMEKKLNEPKTEGTAALGEHSLQKECRAEGGGRMELVVSGLDSSEQGLVRKFARKMKAGVSSQVTASTTHIIIKTDESLVCERTLKYFQGIAGRKWVVSFLWISECFKHGKLLTEAPYEVSGDVVNGHVHHGPRRARTAPDNNLLMKGCEICFQGSFTNMTTDQMEVMVELCGATVMKDPLMFSKKGTRYQLVVVQPDSDDSQSYYAALQRKAIVVTRSWLLDSVAMYKLLNPRDYTP